MTDWTALFPAKTPVLALPGWRNPRVILPVRGFRDGWRYSALYPASRPTARLYRLWQRLKAATRLPSVREVKSDGWAIGTFVRTALPPVSSVVVLVGTPGPAQKVTVQLWGDQNEILGYLKYAEKPAARCRLAKEYRILTGLPDGVAPRPLKLDSMAAGSALLLSPISGSQPKASLPPPRSLLSFLNTLVVAEPLAIYSHPWVQDLPSAIKLEAEPILADLAGRNWPVVIQHGDFAPWNIFQGPGQTIYALDWEYGTLQGFPCLDLAYYILQVAALIHRWSPERARDYAAKLLTRMPALALNKTDALAIIRLAALDAYGKALEDGVADEAQLQVWRRRVWKRNE